jgi:hypothetical protein
VPLRAAVATLVHDEIMVNNMDRRDLRMADGLY